MFSNVAETNTVTVVDVAHLQYVWIISVVPDHMLFYVVHAWTYMYGLQQNFLYYYY